MLDLQLLDERLIVILAVAARMGGFVATAPVFSSRYVPVTVKAAMALYTGLFLSPVLQVARPTAPSGLVYLASTEVLTGLIAGYAASLVFLAVQVAGQIADTEMGFGMINVLDPMHATPVPLMGSFLYLLALLIFLTIDGHHFMLAAIVKSYDAIPAGKVVLDGRLAEAVLTRLAEVWVFGVQLAAPLIVSSLLATVAMGIVARTVPQMNIFIMGVPMKMVLGMFVLGVSLPVFVGFAEESFRSSFGFVSRVMTLLSP